MTTRGRKIKFYTNGLPSISFETTNGDFRLTHGRMVNEIHMHKLSTQLLYDALVLMSRRESLFDDPAQLRKTGSLIKEYVGCVTPALYELLVISIVFYTRKVGKPAEMVVVMEDESEITLRQGEITSLIARGIMSKEQLVVAMDLGFSYLNPTSQSVRDSYNQDKTHDRALAVYAEFQIAAEEYVGL